MMITGVTSIELAKSIFEKAQERGKKGWLSSKQETFLHSLLYKEGRLNEKVKNHYLATVLPSGEWVYHITFEAANEIRSNGGVIRYAYLIEPVFYIKRQGFTAKQIILRQSAD